jgi:hypothetical protein
MHRRKWTCLNGCTKDLRSKAAMIHHNMIEYPDIVNSDQASIFADMCEREIDDTEYDSCLICLETMSLSELYEHLAEHMEVIAVSGLDEADEVELETKSKEVGQFMDQDEGEEAADADEPKYCYCGQGSFGQMIACDSDNCPMEWFHLKCTGLQAVPDVDGKYINMILSTTSLTQLSDEWLCDVCKGSKRKKAKMMTNRH